MTKKSKKATIFTITLAILATLITATASSYPPILNDGINDLTMNNSNIIDTNDIVISNDPNDLEVYQIPDNSSEFKIGQIPFSWEIDRFGILDDEWSIISYNEERCYVKNSKITTTTNYTKATFHYDDVFVVSTENEARIYPNFENLDEFSIIENYTQLYRILSLDNGYSLIKYNDSNLFIKTSELAKRTYLGKFLITYYCPCRICNGSWGAVDYFGNPLVDGTAAVDTRQIPFGTSFQIQENGFMRSCVAKDVGGSIKGKHIDVFVNVSHSVCEQMGSSKKDVYTFTSCE